MKESTLKPVKTTVRILTGLSFLLFIAYQLFLMMQLPEQRFGRLIGIILYLFITVASFFALSHNRVIRVLRSVFFLSGFIALFLIKLLNLFPLFGSLDFSNTPSVLNCAVYVATQIGTLIFVLYYLIIRTNKKIKNKKKITAVLMFFVIALYVSTLLMECVMIIKYRVNIDLSGLSTVISRFIYFFGFVGTAVSFMLPSTKVQSSTEQYINKKQIDEDVMVMSPKKESSHSDKDKKPNPVLENSKLVFSETENIRSQSFQKPKTSGRIRLRVISQTVWLIVPILYLQIPRTSGRIRARVISQNMWLMIPIWFFLTPKKSVRIRIRIKSITVW